MKMTSATQFRLTGPTGALGALLLFAFDSPLAAQPVFTLQPRSRTVAEGTHFYLGAFAGTGNFDFYHDGQKLPSQHSVYYAIASATAADAGDYYQIACDLSGCSTSQIAHITVVPGGALSHWERTWPDGVTAPLGLTAYGNGSYVTAAWDAGNADIVVSDNGINWAAASDRFGLYYGGLVFAQDRFVLAGGEDHGPATVLTSSNGHDWEIAFSDDHWDVLWNLSYSEGVFATIAQVEDGSSSLLRSTNAADWIQVPQSFYSLAVSRGLWLGLSRPYYPDYEVALSTNALDWTNRPTIGLRDDYLFGLAAGPDKFLAYGIYFIKWSEDGVNWMPAELPPAATNPAVISSIAYGTNGYVALMRGSCDSTFCLYPYVHTLNSRDGIHWEAHPFAVDTDVGSVSFVGGVYIATGSQGVVFTSPDGLNWTQRAGFSTRQLRAMAATGTEAVAVGDRGLILSSTNGTRWARYNGITRDDLYAIQFQNGRYVAAGGTSRSLLAESTNGENWSIWTDAAGGPLRGITGDGASLVAVGLHGTVVKSSGGLWTRTAAPGSPDFRSITRLKGFYVAIAYPELSGYPPPPTPGAIYTSENGEADWTLRATNQFAFYDIASGNGRAVVVGAFGTVLVSTDGITWTASDIAVGDHILSIDFAGGRFVAGSRDGNIFSSTNGVDWIGHDLGLQPYYYAQPTIWWIGQAFNRVFAGADYEQMWRSDPLGPKLKLGFLDTNGWLHCTIEDLAGSTFRIQYSTDLQSWSDLMNFTTLQSQELLLPYNASESRGFFRVAEP